MHMSLGLEGVTTPDIVYITKCCKQLLSFKLPEHHQST